jgi:hypothetical protein
VIVAPETLNKFNVVFQLLGQHIDSAAILEDFAEQLSVKRGDAAKIEPTSFFLPQIIL